MLRLPRPAARRWNIVFGFHVPQYPQGHQPTDYWRWIKSHSAYPVKYEVREAAGLWGVGGWAWLGVAAASSTCPCGPKASTVRSTWCAHLLC